MGLGDVGDWKKTGDEKAREGGSFGTRQDDVGLGALRVEPGRGS